MLIWLFDISFLTIGRSATTTTSSPAITSGFNCAYLLSETGYQGDEISLIESIDFQDFSLSVKIKSNENFHTKPTANIAILFGYQNNTNFYFLKLCHYNPENKLYRTLNGSNIVLAQYNAPTIATNDWYEIRIERYGESIIVYLNELEIMNTNDNTFPSGKIALGSHKFSAYFDDVEISYTLPSTNINVLINQIDPSSFPVIDCYVTVTDQTSQPITGLDETNFEVKEDQILQSPITVIPQGGSSIVNIAFAMDYSGSMSGQAIYDMEAAVRSFVDLMNADDEGAIFKFAKDVLKYQGFTSEKSLLYAAINAGFSGNTGSTKLYDAIIMCVSEAIAQQGRKAVIALTDGEDNDSNHSLNDAIIHAQNYNIPIFTIGLGGSVNSTVLNQIASSTGGQYYYAPSSSDLQAIYAQIANILANQYRVTYTTSNPSRDCDWRDVEIAVNYSSLYGNDTTRYQSPCDTNFVDLWIDDDLVGASGDTVYIAVHTSDMTGKDIYSVGMTITYDPAVLAADGIEVENTLVENWGTPEIQLSSGEIVVGVAGVNPLEGSGHLINIVFIVTGSEGQTTPLTFSDVLLNEGSPVANTDDGFFTVIDNRYSISGKVGYYYDFINTPIGDVTLQLTGGISASTLTDNDGNYLFDDLQQTDYVLTPTKSSDIKNSITAYDAALILQNYVGMIDLAPYQMIAGDVTGNGEITPFDASFILRYTVGSVQIFPVGKEWTFVPTEFLINEMNWHDAPDSLNFAPLYSDMIDQNFVGIIYGDASGNWNTARKGATVSANFVIAEPAESESNQIIIPIEIQIKDEAFSGKLRLEYDSSEFEFISIRNTAEITDLIISHHEQNGEITIAFASPISLAQKTISLGCLFKKLSDLKSPLDNFNLLELQIDDQIAITTVVKNIEDATVAVDYKLFQNHPNPFNSETVIRYNLPTSSHVVIEIYNQLGQKVRTLLNQQNDAGNHQVKWNGLDDNYQPVVSGVYLYKMRAGNFTAIKKMAFVR